MMYVAAAVGLMMAGAVMAPEPSSAAVATSSPRSRQLRFTSADDGPGNSEGDEGDEGDEGNEGLDAFVQSRTAGGGNDGNEGNEGDEGNEGNEGNEGDEGNEGNDGDEGNEGNEGNEGDEGNEGSEGDEGDEGGVVPVSQLKNFTLASVICTGQATANSLAAMENAHVAVIATVFTEFCRTDTDPVAASIALAATDSALALARAVTSTQDVCVSAGKAFDCAPAAASAEAWASAHATAEAHEAAVAASAEACECLTQAQALAIGTATTFITLAADAFARAEVTACSEGDADFFAAAFTDCAALAYATVWTKAIAEAFLEGDCFSSEVATRILDETSGTFGVIEGCKRDFVPLPCVEYLISTSCSPAEGRVDDHI